MRHESPQRTSIFSKLASLPFFFMPSHSGSTLSLALQKAFRWIGSSSGSHPSHGEDSQLSYDFTLEEISNFEQSSQPTTTSILLEPKITMKPKSRCSNENQMTLISRQIYPLKCLLKADNAPELSMNQFQALISNFETAPFISDLSIVKQTRQEFPEFVSRIKSLNHVGFQQCIPMDESLVSEYELACVTRFDSYAEFIGIRLIHLFDRLFPINPKSFLSLLTPFPHCRDLLVSYIAARLPNFSILDMAEVNPNDQIQVYRRHYFLHRIYSELVSLKTSSQREKDEATPPCRNFGLPCHPSDGRVVVMIRGLIHDSYSSERKSNGMSQPLSRKPAELRDESIFREQFSLITQLTNGVEKIAVRGIYEALEWLRWVIDSRGSLDGSMPTITENVIKEESVIGTEETNEKKLWCGNNGAADRRNDKRRRSLLVNESQEFLTRSGPVKRRKMEDKETGVISSSSKEPDQANYGKQESNDNGKRSYSACSLATPVASVKLLRPIICQLKLDCLQIVSDEIHKIPETIIDTYPTSHLLEIFRHLENADFAAIVDFLYRVSLLIFSKALHANESALSVEQLSTLLLSLYSTVQWRYVDVQVRKALSKNLQGIGQLETLPDRNCESIISLRNQLLAFLETVEPYCPSVLGASQLRAKPERGSTRCDYHVSRCNGASWDISNHPMRRLLEVHEGCDAESLKSKYSEVIMKRPREFPVEIRPNTEYGGIRNGEIKMFDCEYLWKMTRACVGSHPLVGIVSNRGNMPNLYQGAVQQQKDEFGFSIDLETTDVCLVYGEGSSCKSNLINGLPSRRSKYGVSQSPVLVSTPRRSTRLARQVEEHQHQVNTLQSNNITRSMRENELTDEPFALQFHGATMIHPIRIVVDRVHNRILALTPTSNIHFEISIPQLAKIKGPVVPIVSFPSGGFRGYFSSSHPAFSTATEEFLQDYLGEVEKTNVSASLSEAQPRRRKLPFQRYSNLTLFNPSLLGARYAALWPSSTVQTTQEEAPKSGKERGRRIRGTGVSWFGTVGGKLDVLMAAEGQSVRVGGSKTMMKYQKTPVHLCPGAPRRRRFNGASIGSARDVAPSSASPPSTGSSTPCSPRQQYSSLSPMHSMHLQPYGDIYQRQTQSIVTKSPTAFKSLSAAFHLTTKTRRSNSSIGLSSKRNRKPKCLKTKTKLSKKSAPSTAHSVSSEVESAVDLEVISTTVMPVGGIEIKRRRRRKGWEDEEDWNPNGRQKLKNKKYYQKRKRKQQIAAGRTPQISV